MQKTYFTFKEVCSYILYRAMEEERTTNKGLYDSNQLADDDGERVHCILGKIKGEGRIKENVCGGNKAYVKI